MIKVKNNQQGFSAVELMLILVIVVLIVVVGWLVYKDHHKTTTSTSTTTSTTSSTQSKISESSVTQLVKTFYNKYSDCFSNGNLNQTCTTNLVNQYGTSNLYSYYKPTSGSYAEDPIMCSQDSPSNISVSTLTATSSSATGTVVENFGTSSSNVKFSVIKQGGNLKLDSVTCSPPAVVSTQAS